MIIDEKLCCAAVEVMGNITIISVTAIDSALCCVHTLFLAVVAVSLLLLRLTKTNRVERSYLPSYTTRTILMLVLITSQVLLLLKDILSAEPRISSCVASLLTVVGTSAALLYIDTVGNTRPWAVVRVLLLYWFTCLALWLLRLIACLLLQQRLTAEFSICLLLDTFVSLIYVGLLVLECVSVIGNVSVHFCYIGIV